MLGVVRKRSQEEREEKDNKRGEKGQGRKEGVREEGRSRQKSGLKAGETTVRVLCSNSF